MTRRYTPMPSGAPFDVPDNPPRDWFAAPTWMEPGESCVILDDGRFGARLFDHGLPVEHHAGRYVPAPSVTSFAAFHTGVVVCDDGTPVKVGSVGYGHPAELSTTTEGYYSHPTRRCAVARAGVDDLGVWLAGVLVPRLPADDRGVFFTGAAKGLRAGDVAAMRACAVSGDWRPMSSEWWEAHGHQASLAATELELVGVGLGITPRLPQPGHGRARPRLTQTAALEQADLARAAALSDVLTCRATYERAQARATAAAVASARLPNERLSAVTAAVAHRAGRPQRPNDPALSGRLALLSSQRRVRGEQLRLGRALDRLQEADVALSLELVDAIQAPLPRPVAKLRIHR